MDKVKWFCHIQLDENLFERWKDEEEKRNSNYGGS